MPDMTANNDPVETRDENAGNSQDESPTFGSETNMSSSSSSSIAPVLNETRSRTPTTTMLGSPNRQSSLTASNSTSDFQGTTTPGSLQGRGRRRYVYKSNRISGPIDKPWLDNPIAKKRARIPAIMMGVAFFLGLGIVGLLAWNGYASVPRHTYRTVLDIERFDSIDPDIWEFEQQVGGFGNGVFDWTTDSKRNAYVEDGRLYIVPTLTEDVYSDAEINNGYTVNLTRAGTCTGSTKSACEVTSNSTTGTILPPVQSARLTTRFSRSIKYGRVEVRAKMPRGDWLWPAIWMMPVHNTYGAWPASGEIDIAESVGNNHTYLGRKAGRNQVTSTLHWGPSSEYDRYYKTSSSLNGAYKDYTQEFHTFGLEWSEKYLYTYLDNRLLQIMYTPFKSSFWSKGDFPAASSNSTPLVDPWSQTGENSTPFDQEFYLILNVDVGGTNGWFPDGKGGKPWVDSSDTAPRDFWNAKDQWYPTWPKNDYDRAMVVESVKMYQQLT